MGPHDKWAPSHRGVCDMVVKDGVELKYVYAEVYGKATVTTRQRWVNALGFYKDNVLNLVGIVGGGIL